MLCLKFHLPGTVQPGVPLTLGESVCNPTLLSEVWSPRCSRTPAAVLGSLMLAPLQNTWKSNMGKQELFHPMA